MSTKSILVIPDQHIKDGQNLRRFDALGNLILDRQPDYVVNLGDMFEFDYLYGIHGKKSWSYRDDTAEKLGMDLNHGRDASKRLFNPLNKYNEKQRKNRKKPLVTRKYLTKGNHDDRAELYFKFNEKQMMEAAETPNYDEWFGQNRFYDEILPYQKPLEIEGILFSHNYVNGTATASTVGTIMALAAQSAVGGHSHKAEFKASYSSNGRPIFGLQAGWFADPDESLPDWVGAQGGKEWWNGVCYLHGVTGSGAFDPEFMSTTRLLSEYM